MTQQSGSEGAREGLFAALKNTAATLVAIVKTRGELLVNELEEEKFRLLSLLMRGIGAVLLLMLGIVMVVACVAMIFWEQRVFVFGAFAVLFIAAGWLLLGSIKHESAKQSPLFRDSLAELDVDLAELRRAGRSE
jgi:uncharacterized membrane protein YqjE